MAADRETHGLLKVEKPAGGEPGKVADGQFVLVGPRT